MPKLEASFFRPFVDGAIHTLKVSCATAATPGQPFIKGKQKQPSFDIAGVIALSSSGFTGSITIGFPGPVFLELMSKMLGEKFTELNAELQDGAAELLNMIFGHAKVALNSQGHTLQKALPTVIRGAGLQTSHLGTRSPVMVLPFLTPYGEFHVEIVAEGE